MRDICIIGGGASGMAAAITAARENPSLSILIVEKKDALGKKLAATGNGKCNLTNAACPGVRQTLEFFMSLGIVTRTDEQGRIYPYSQQAKDVVYGMERQIRVFGIDQKTDRAVERLEKELDGFRITLSDGEQLTAGKVLLASGGKAAPQFGTTGDGYRLAKQLGHGITKLSPALAALEVDDDFRTLKGIRVKAAAGLLKDSALISQEEGEVQFAADGLSGICIFDLSRFVKIRQGEDFREGIRRYGVRLDFLPHMDEEQVLDFLAERCRLRGLAAEDILLSVVPRALAKKLLQEAGIRAKALAREQTAEKLSALASQLKGWYLTLTGVKGWKTAQCTAGGVALDQIDEETMESRLVPGLYFSGEIIDYDGPCGGFNLQNAWETGIKAGKAMANVL